MADTMTAAKWLQRIQRAQKVREAWLEKFRVKTCYAYAEGQTKPAGVSENEWININLIYSSLLAELPSLYATDPHFYVKLQKSYTPDPNLVVQYDVMGEKRAAMLNYLKKELELKPKARLGIYDAHFQFGVVKVYAEVETAENPSGGQPIIGDDGQIMMGEGGKPLVEPDEVPESTTYHVERLHPDDFLVDGDAGPLPDDWGWVAQRIRRPLDDVKTDKRFKASVRKKLKATELSQDERERQQRKGLASLSEGDTEPDIAVLWEIYDLKGGQWLVVADGGNDYLVAPEDVPLGIEKHPFVLLRFFLRDDSFYPLPPVSQLVDPQREYSDCRTKVMIHRKRFNRKYLAPGLSDDDATKLSCGDDGTVIVPDNPNAMVNPIADAPLDQQVHMELAYLRKDFDELSVGANQRGSAQGVDSATEAGILEKRSALREGDKQGLVVDWLRDIGRKLDQLVQAHITETQIVRVTGPDNKDVWTKIRTDDYQKIDGEYEYGIEVGSTTPQLPEIERAQWVAFLGMLSNAPWLASSPRLMERTAEMFHLRDKTLVAEMTQIAQKMMQAQAQQGAGQKGAGSAPGVPEGVRPQSAPGGGMGINNMMPQV